MKAEIASHHEQRERRVESQERMKALGAEAHFAVRNVERAVRARRFDLMPMGEVEREVLTRYLDEAIEALVAIAQEANLRITSA